MHYILGLGNPGSEYEKTRHNTGRLVLTDFIKKHGVLMAADKKLKAMSGRGGLGKEKFQIIFPETFMNKSGSSVRAVVKSKKAVENLIVFHDDIDLPLGGIKISFGRGSGGHKGVESVIRAVKTKDFTRVRIGVSPHTSSGKLKKPGTKEINDFIVSNFKPVELEEVKKVSKKATIFLETILVSGREKAMSSRKP